MMFHVVWGQPISFHHTGVPLCHRTLSCHCRFTKIYIYTRLRCSESEKITYLPVLFNWCCHPCWCATFCAMCPSCCSVMCHCCHLLTNCCDKFSYLSVLVLLFCVWLVWAWPGFIPVRPSGFSWPLALLSGAGPSNLWPGPWPFRVGPGLLNMRVIIYQTS